MGRRNIAMHLGQQRLNPVRILDPDDNLILEGAGEKFEVV
jgi:hypothetical protein